MALRAIVSKFSDLRKRSGADECATAEPQEERKTMPIAQPRPRRCKSLDAGPFTPEIGSFRLHLAAEGKAPKTVRTYVEAVAWFAAAHLLPRTSCTGWAQVSCHDVQRWLVHLLTRYSDAYANNQFRALQQFFRWLADEEELPDPMTGLRAPKVSEKLVPVFTSEELPRCRRRARAGRSLSGATPRSSRCSPRRESVPGSWPGSALTCTTLAVVIWICGPGRSPYGARAVSRGWSESATRPPVPWTVICRCAPGTARRGGATVARH